METWELNDRIAELDGKQARAALRYIAESHAPLVRTRLEEAIRG